MIGSHLKPNCAREMFLFTLFWDSSIQDNLICQQNVFSSFWISQFLYLLVSEPKTLKLDLAILFIHWEPTPTNIHIENVMYSIFGWTNARPVEVHVASYVKVESAGVPDKDAVLADPDADSALYWFFMSVLVMLMLGHLMVLSLYTLREAGFV